MKGSKLIREKCDEEGSDFSEEGDNHEIYVCARELKEKGKLKLFEQIDSVEKEGVHDINRRVIVTEEFIKKLADLL